MTHPEVERHMSVCTRCSVAVLLLLLAPAIRADQLDELTFLAGVSASPTAPDPPDTSGVFILTAVTRRAPDGSLVEASYRFQTFIELPRDEIATGYSLREGAPGAGGPIAIDTFFSPASPIDFSSGPRNFQATNSVRDPASLETLQRVFDRPGDFYIEIRTLSAPDGLFQSGRLLRREQDWHRAIFDPIDGLNAGASASLRFLTDRNADGSMANGTVLAEVLGLSLTDDNSGVGPEYHITGLRLRRGGVGETGPVLYEFPVGGSFSVASGFFGVTSTATAAGGDLQAYADALAAAPDELYFEMDSAAGTRRAQVLPTEQIDVNVGMSPAGLEGLPAAPGPAQGSTGRSPFASLLIRVFATRDRDTGEINSADVRSVTLFDFSPGPVALRGVVIHLGGPGEIGPELFNLNFSNPRPIPSFSGYEFVFGRERVGPFLPTVVESLRNFLNNPENYYARLASDDGREVRGQLSEALLSPPLLSQGGIINAAEAVYGVVPIAPAAPRGLTSIFGANLAGVAASSSLDPEGKMPRVAGGTGVWIGEQPARILFRSPNQLNVQIPDLAPGTYMTRVETPGGLSNLLPLAVTETAPGILVMTHADYSLITEANPLRSGETFIIWVTGLGVATPAVGPGELAPAGAVPVAPVQVLFNADPQTTAGVALSPGFAGLEQIAATAGQLQAGSVDVRVVSGSATSNAVSAPTAP